MKMKMKPMDEEEVFCRAIERIWDELINLGYSQEELRWIDYKQQAEIALAGLENDKTADRVVDLIREGKILQPKSDKVFIAGSGYQDDFYGFRKDLPFTYEDLKRYQLSKYADERYKRLIARFLTHQALVRNPSPELRQLLLQTYEPLINSVVRYYRRQFWNKEEKSPEGGDVDSLRWQLREEAERLIDNFNFYHRKWFKFPGFKRTNIESTKNDKAIYSAAPSLREVGSITNDSELSLTHYLDFHLRKYVKEQGYLSKEPSPDSVEKRVEDYFGGEMDRDPAFMGESADNSERQETEAKQLIAEARQAGCEDPVEYFESLGTDEQEAVKKRLSEAAEPDSDFQQSRLQQILPGDEIREPIEINGKKYGVIRIAAKHYGRCEKTIRRWKEAGKIKAYRWSSLQPDMQNKPDRYRNYWLFLLD